MPPIRPKAEVILEDGWYPAEIGETELKETKFGEKLMVPVEVDGGDEGIVEITAFLTLSDHPKSTIVKWGKSLFGELTNFETEDLDNMKVEVFVEEGESNDGEPKNFIRKIRQPGKGKKAAKGAKPTAPDASDERESDESFDDLNL